MTLKAGTRVHVEFDGVIEDPDEARSLMGAEMARAMLADGSSVGGFYQVTDEHGIYHLVWVCGSACDSSVLKVTATPEPAGWPPQLGDIWEVEGREYFAYESYLSDYQSVDVYPFEKRRDGGCSGGYSDQGYGSKRLDDLKALSPVLIRRRP